MNQPHGLVLHIRSEVGANEFRADKASAAEIGYHPRAREISSVKSGAQHLRGKNIGVLQACPSEIRLQQPGLVEDSAVELCAYKLGFVESGGAKNSGGEIEPGEIET